MSEQHPPGWQAGTGPKSTAVESKHTPPGELRYREDYPPAHLNRKDLTEYQALLAWRARDAWWGDLQPVAETRIANLTTALEDLMWRFEDDDSDPYNPEDVAPDVVQARAELAKAKMEDL